MYTNYDNSKYLEVIDNFLSKEECTFLITFAENQGMKKIDRGSVAQYHRAEFDNDWLADMLYQRLVDKGLIPAYYNGSKVVGLNNHFRVSKYYPDGEFKIHKDGINVDKNGNRSVMTLNIFLNKEFDGGETDFFFENKTFRCSVKPEIGRAAFFDAQQYHRGNKVNNGLKYLLRTDLMVYL